MRDPNSLYHYGVLGMKWGRHKTRQAAYEKKVRALSKSKDKKFQTTTDYSRMVYRAKPLAARAVNPALNAITRTVLRDMITGDINNYMSMTPAQIAKKVGGIAAQTAATVAYKDALARSTASKYDDKGKRVVGKMRTFSREDAIDSAIKFGTTALPFVNLALQMKARDTWNKRAENKAAVDRMMGRMLSEKYDNVIWTSDDGKRSVIDNRGR